MRSAMKAAKKDKRFQMGSEKYGIVRDCRTKNGFSGIRPSDLIRRCKSELLYLEEQEDYKRALRIINKNLSKG